MSTKPLLNILSVCLLGTVATTGSAAQWDVKITNLTNGNHFTPVLMTGLDSATHLFKVGAAASTALELMAECGDTSQLIDTGPAGALDEDTKTGAGVIAPGGTTTLVLDNSMSGNTHLSLVSMILPTNDAFVGLESMEVPAAAGTYTYYLNAYDAGTEANNEIPATTACDTNVSGYPGAPGGDTGSNGTGVTMEEANMMIHVHRGVLGDQDSMGGLSDLNSSIHR